MIPGIRKYENVVLASAEALRAVINRTRKKAMQTKIKGIKAESSFSQGFYPEFTACAITGSFTILTLVLSEEQELQDLAAFQCWASYSCHTDGSIST